MHELETLEELESYLNIVIGQDAGILFLCVFGAVLNSVMLYMLLSKKQIRSSVHTVYMIQIALTDLLVCMVWLVLTSVRTSNLLQMKRDPEDYENTPVISNDSKLSEVYAAAVAKDESSPAQYRSWRIMYTWYNFHYYTNILLLASMSVERCAAVWKSMRCQRYQYNRKIIIGISVFMWIVALCFVLPDLINPDLMVSDGDSPDSVSRTVTSEIQVPSVGPNGWGNKTEETLNEIFDGRKPVDIVVDGAERGGALEQDFLARPYENEEKNYQKDMDILFACYLLWAKALHNNEKAVMDHERVTVHGCLIEFFAISIEYGNYSTGNNVIDDELPESDFPELSGDIFPPYYPDDYELTALDGAGKMDTPPGDNGGEDINLSRNISMYSGLLIDALKALMSHHTSFRMGRHEACDPDLSDTARIYVLVVNLVLGFFVPFSIIVFSYVSIAYMIGKRARSRMNPIVSETSTTHLAHNYQNPSSTNAQTAIRLRDKNSRNRPDSVGRRMSDFMRNLVLRKPQDGAESQSYFTDSDREATPFGSMQKMRYSSASRRHEDSSSANAKFDNPVHNRPQQKSPDNDSEEDPLYDPELQEAIRQLNSVRMRNPENPRIKKYSFGHDTANENIPQTIEEHPHEIEAEAEDDRFLTASNGSCPNDATPPGMRNHTALLMAQRNSKRESGGSYGSSMDSMATDQTSLMTSHHDKRCSGATTLSALTPPTPIEPSNPNSNQFFPSSEERLAAHNRSHSAEAGYPLLGDDQQRSPRPQKPGSQLNDITLQLYRKSLQKKHPDDGEFDNLPRRNENNVESPSNQGPGTSGQMYNPQERYSYPRMSQGKSTSEDRLSSSRLSTRSTARLINEPQRSSHGEEGETKQNSTQPKYNRLNSSTSTVHYNRGRTYSTTSKGSTGASTMRKTMVRKNAERHLRVSRTVLAYVIVFSICWLPQRITYLLYVIEALKGASNAVCTKLIASVRIVSFISVLLNPAVYILTQRDFQEYVRNSICVSKLRRWYAKCSKKPSNHRESNTESRGRVVSSDRNDDIELQERRSPEDREQYGNNNRQISNGGGWSPPYRMASPTRPNVRKSPNGLQHEMFPPPTGINVRQRDATIDELKEEEAAAEESLEKEMERLAAEEEKRRQDDINKNFLESSEDDVISAKNTTGSGNKTTSSSSKSETFEEFWKRWLESGNGNLPSPEVPTQMEPRFPDLEELAKVSAPSGTNNPQRVLQ